MDLPGFSASIDLAGVPWRATRYPGVRWVSLLSGPAEGKDATVLIQMDPGSSYPPHRHRGVEEVLVLQGGYTDELGLHAAGHFVRYPAGSAHAPVALGDPGRPVGPDNPACLLFASARAGVENLEIPPAG